MLTSGEEDSVSGDDGKGTKKRKREKMSGDREEGKEGKRGRGEEGRAESPANFCDSLAPCWRQAVAKIRRALLRFALLDEPLGWNSTNKEHRIFTIAPQQIAEQNLLSLLTVPGSA